MLRHSGNNPLAACGKIDGGFYRSDLASTMGSGAVLVILSAVGLEKSRDAVIAGGGTTLGKIYDSPGERRFQFADPRGNELAVWSDQ